jgi:MFS family permease
VPFHIFRVQTVAGANVCGLLLGAITFANFFLLTLYVQQVLGYSAIKTGVTFVVTAGSAILWAGVAQNLTTRLGVKPVLAAGFLAMIAGAIYYTQIPASGSFVTALLPGYLLIGFGLPFTFIPISIAALAGVSHDEAGLASGLINTAQQIGGAVGIAICASVSVSRFNHLIALHGPSYYAQAFTSATALAFWVLVGISVVAFVAGLVLIRKEELAPEAEEAYAG